MQYTFLRNRFASLSKNYNFSDNYIKYNIDTTMQALYAGLKRCSGRTLIPGTGPTELPW